MEYNYDFGYEMGKPASNGMVRIILWNPTTAAPVGATIDTGGRPAQSPEQSLTLSRESRGASGDSQYYPPAQDEYGGTWQSVRDGDDVVVLGSDAFLAIYLTKDGEATIKLRLGAPAAVTYDDMYGRAATERNPCPTERGPGWYPRYLIGPPTITPALGNDWWLTADTEFNFAFSLNCHPPS